DSTSRETPATTVRWRCLRQCKGRPTTSNTARKSRALCRIGLPVVRPPSPGPLERPVVPHESSSSVLLVTALFDRAQIRLPQRFSHLRIAGTEDALPARTQPQAHF